MPKKKSTKVTKNKSLPKFENNGKTTLAPEVLTTIAKMAALTVKGVSRFAIKTGNVNRIFKRGAEDGIEIKVEDGLVYVELDLIFKSNVNVREVSRNVQLQVARAISEMINLEVGHINIHVNDIDYSAGTRA